MGKCLSNTAPTDYGELSGGNHRRNTESLTPRSANNKKYGKKVSKTSSATDIIKGSDSTIHSSTKYRKMTQESVISIETENMDNTSAENINFDQIEINECIVIEDLVKIYNFDSEQYEHFGLLLNAKQCKLYLVNAHYFSIWKEFEKRTKMNEILTSDEHKNNANINNIIFCQNDAEQMIANLVPNNGSSKENNLGKAINCIMRKSKYEIERDILLTKEWNLSLSTILNIENADDLIDGYIDHVVITRFNAEHIEFILDFFRLYGLIIKYHCIENKNTLHIIFMNECLKKDIAMFNEQIMAYLSAQTKDKINSNIEISAYYDQIMGTNDDEQNEQIQIIELDNLYTSIRPISVFDGDNMNNLDTQQPPIDGFLYGFEIKSNDENVSDFLCLLSSNNRRFEWIAHIEHILCNVDFIKELHSSTLKNKRSNFVELDKNLTNDQNKCNENECTHCLRLLAMNKLFENNKDDICEIIINRKIDLLAVYNSYIHCAVEANHSEKYIQKFMTGPYEKQNECKQNEKSIHYIRYNAESNDQQNRLKYYQQYKHCNIHIIQFLDQIHCFLYYRNMNESHLKNGAINTRKRRNSQKFIRDFTATTMTTKKDQKSKQKQQYFGGQMLDYWTSMNAYSELQSSDDLLINDDYEKDGVVVIYNYQSLKEEVTQNIVCRLHEDEYNDIYQKALYLMNTRYCKKNLTALFDARLNEKFKIAPNELISVNHVICILIYSNYFNVCCKWIDFMRNTKVQNTEIIHESESMETMMTDNFGEFAFFHRYLCEIVQIFGSTMKQNEYLYVMPTKNILFTQWNQMINFPISVTPPLDISQSFMKELRQYQNENNKKEEEIKHNLLKLGPIRTGNGMETRYFDVRWLADSFDEDERFMMMSPVKIVDILLNERRSCLKDVAAMDLFQRIMSGDFFNCVSTLNQVQTQKKLYALIQNHIYKNVKEKCFEKMPSFEYIQSIFDNLVMNVIGTKNDGSFLWLNKSELNRLKSKELAAMIYNVRNNALGTLLNHFEFDMERIRFVQEYEFKIGHHENALDDLVKSADDKRIISEDFEYILHDIDCRHQRHYSLVEQNNNEQDTEKKDAEKVRFYFEFAKKIIVQKLYGIEEEENKKNEKENDFECYLWINLIDLPQNMDKVLISCNVYCEDLNKQIKFEPVWASTENDNTTGGLILDKNITKSLKGLASLSFVITLKILQTNAVRSPTKSILGSFPSMAHTQPT